MLQKIKNQNPSPDCSGNPFLEAERSRSHQKRLQRKAGLKLKRNEKRLAPVFDSAQTDENRLLRRFIS